MTVERIGRYEIVANIGDGGMATVYRAREPGSERDLAVKVLRPEHLTDLGFRGRFQREAQTIAALQHPAIVPVLDFGQYHEQLYLVMPYMPGGSLALRLLQGPLSPEQALEVLERIAAALDDAHRHGVVHRDLKPSNILFDADGGAYLADFGIALQAADAGAGGDVIDGTPAYMSPEQCRPEADVDPRSDVYSLGVTLFQMLTGSPPFRGDTALAILTQHIYEPPPSLRSLNSDVPASLETVLQKALAKDPDARYQSAGALAVAYRSALDNPAAKQEAMDATEVEVVAPAPEVTVAEDSPVKVQQWDEEGSAPGDGLPPVASLARKYGAWLADHFYVALALVSVLGIACAVAVMMVVRGPDALLAWGVGDGAPSDLANAEQGSAAFSASATAMVYLPRIDAAARESGAEPTAEATPAPNLLLLYSEEMATVVNVSGADLSLAGVSFRRVATESAGEAAFAADEWRGVAGNRVDALPAGDCLQLVRLGAGRTGPQKPEVCDTMRGWLGTSRRGSLFFLPEAGVDAFQVLRGDELLGTCAMADGECRLRLPDS